LSIFLGGGRVAKRYSRPVFLLGDDRPLARSPPPSGSTPLQNRTKTETQLNETQVQQKQQKVLKSVAGKNYGIFVFRLAVLFNHKVFPERVACFADD